jgi:hypothetical protein
MTRGGELLLRIKKKRTTTIGDEFLGRRAIVENQEK